MLRLYAARHTAIWFQHTIQWFQQGRSSFVSSLVNEVVALVVVVAAWNATGRGGTDAYGRPTLPFCEERVCFCSCRGGGAAAVMRKGRDGSACLG